MKTYTDKDTGLTVQINSDGSWDVTALPAAPGMLPSIVRTGRGAGDTDAERQADAEVQANAVIADYGKAQEPEPQPEAEPAKEEAKELKVEEPAEGKEEEDEKDTVPLSGKLPDDFPGKAALDAADPPIHTYKQLSKFADDYTAIPGIGPVTAEKIAETLK